MKFYPIAILFVSALVFVGCQSAVPINPDDYVLRTLMPDEGGSDCHLIEVSTDKEIASFFADGVRGEEACKIIGFWDRTLFAQISPDDLGYMGFYEPYFRFYGIDIDTGQVDELGYLIDWVDNGGLQHLQHKGAFSIESNDLILRDFVTGKKITFVIPETFADKGSPFTNEDDSMVVFSAVVGDYSQEFPAVLSTSIFVGNVNTGLAEEIYSYDGWLYLTGWAGEDIEFSENGQVCYLSKDGSDKRCGLSVD